MSKNITCKDCGRTVDLSTAKKERWYIADSGKMCFHCIKIETLEQMDAEREFLAGEYKRHAYRGDC